MLRETAALVVLSLLMVTGCRSRTSQPVEAVDGTEDVAAFALTSLRGTRDGERLDVRAVFGAGSRTLTVDLHINVTPPARLTSGTWTGLATQGEVRERSMTFLGGQSSQPSIGGRFDLLGPDQRALYRITIPLQESTTRL